LQAGWVCCLAGWLARSLGCVCAWNCRLSGILEILGILAGCVAALLGFLDFVACCTCWLAALACWLAVSLSCCLAGLLSFLPGWMADLKTLLGLLVLWPAGLLSGLAILLSR
jgi:hypothetical protein